MGLWHDRYKESPLNYSGPALEDINFPFKPYGFGYVNQTYRPVCEITIMAYKDQCKEDSLLSSKFQIKPIFSNPSKFFDSGDRAGVTGSDQDISLTGPANASLAINDVWEDTLIHLQSSSDSCKNTVFSDLETTISFSFEAGMESFTLSDIPDYCAENDLTATSTDTFIRTSTQTITQSDDTIDFEVDITLLDENRTCSDRTGQVTLTGEAGAEKILSIVQNPAPIRRLICESAPSQVFEDIVSLDLSDQGISKLKNFFFDNLTGLKELDLSENEITSINKDVFFNLARVEELDLSQNQLSILPADGFFFLLSLQELDLSENEITSIDDRAFYDLASLEELDLSQNQLSILQDNAFKFLSDLQELDLSENQISSINSHTFHNLIHLEELDLNQNRLRELPSNGFFFLYGLEELDLSENRIDSIDQLGFRGLKNLEALDLSGNQINSVSQEMFSEIPTLKYLWLNANSIITLSSNVFSTLSNLKSLALDENELTRLPSGLFSDLSKLRYLWLNTNNITTLPNNIFSDLSRLRYLNLSYNSFTPLPDGVCTFLRSLRYLVIKGNSLDTICPVSALVSLGNIFKVFSFKIPFLGQPTQHFVNRAQSFDLEEVEYDEKIILKLHENRIHPSDISQIMGLSERRISNVITHHLLDNVILKNNR